MSRHLHRLRRGEPWWAAELGLRSLGLALLYASDRLALRVHQQVIAPPLHQSTPSAFLLCAAAFFLLSCGLALTLVGPGLLRHVPIPRRRLI